MLSVSFSSSFRDEIRALTAVTSFSKAPCLEWRVFKVSTRLTTVSFSADNFLSRFNSSSVIIIFSSLPKLSVRRSTLFVNSLNVSCFFSTFSRQPRPSCRRSSTLLVFTPSPYKKPCTSNMSEDSSSAFASKSLKHFRVSSRHSTFFLSSFNLTLNRSRRFHNCSSFSSLSPSPPDSPLCLSLIFTSTFTSSFFPSISLRNFLPLTSATSLAVGSKFLGKSSSSFRYSSTVSRNA